MTNQDMQNAMAFILEQQAQSSAKIDALSEAQKEAQETQRQAQKDAEERWRRSEERWTRTEESIRALLSIAQNT